MEKLIDPLQDPVTWYRINYAGMQVTQLCNTSKTIAVAIWIMPLKNITICECNVVKYKHICLCCYQKS